MGLELFSPDEDRAAVVTAILTPDGIDARELVRALRDRFGITVAGGHGELGPRMFRIGHIGYYDVLDITAVLAAVEVLLVESGADVERGTAVARALEAYRETTRV
jgi:aspartate aminotransferase-like enzyme